MASPTAAAGISRILQKAGHRRAIEIQSGVELQGFYASPAKGDHVVVEFVPGPFVDEPGYLGLITAALAEYKEVLVASKYQVEETVGLMAFPGEGPMREMPVLHVRSERWGR